MSTFDPQIECFCLDFGTRCEYFSRMQRTVRREIIDQWIDEAYPNALTHLSKKSGVPASSISKIRNGRVPKNGKQRQRLAKALGVDAEKLFPVSGGSRAS